MKNEEYERAKNLFFQTSLTKTEIATILNISRRTLHIWVKEGNWERLKRSATSLPSEVTEHCYMLIMQLTSWRLAHIGSPPVSFEEASTIHRLALSIGKLRNRSTLNESMEMFGFFLQRLKKKDPDLADKIVPHMDDYLASRVNIDPDTIFPAGFDANGQRDFGQAMELRSKLLSENLLDLDDYHDWENEHLYPQDTLQKTQTT